MVGGSKTIMKSTSHHILKVLVTSHNVKEDLDQDVVVFMKYMDKHFTKCVQKFVLHIYF